MGKGKQWLLAEDTALAKAWVEVAESATAGPDDTFWSLVHANWVARPGGSQRSQQALKNHWRFLQVAVRTFGKYVRDALAESSSDAASGDNDCDDGTAAAVDGEEPVTVSDDVTDRALRLYLDSECESFTLVPVWRVLQKSAKWHSSKTPGSSLKRSRATSGYIVKSEKLNKRLSLPAGVGNGLAESSDTEAPAPAAPAALPAPRRPKPDAAAIARVRAADRRLSLPAPAATRTESAAAASPRRPSTNGTSATTSASTADAAHVRQSTYSTAAEQLASALRDANDSAAHEMLQTLIVANDPVQSAVAPPPRDSYAASIAELAAAQVEKNALVADQMLMAMLLADPSDGANKAALAQLKQKYLRRAFPGTDRAAGASGGTEA